MNSKKITSLLVVLSLLAGLFLFLSNVSAMSEMKESDQVDLDRPQMPRKSSLLRAAIPESRASSSIVGSPKHVVTTANTVIPEKYDFIMHFTKDTKVKPFGSNWKVHDKNWGGNYSGYTVVKPKDELKGKIGVVYTNVAEYNNQKVDLKITVTGWSQYLNKGKTTLITYGDKGISHSQSGFNYVNQRWEFINQKTGKPLAVEGFFVTFNDLDSNQYVQLNKSSVANTEKVYTPKNSTIRYEKKSDENKYSNEDGINADPTNDRYTMTVTFNKASQFNFKWGKDYNKAGYNKDWFFDPAWTGGDYLGYVDTKIARSEIPKPSKSIVVKDKLVTSSVMEKKTDAIDYQIHHRVPKERDKFYYKSYTLSDTLAHPLELKSTSIKDANGTNRNSYFKVSQKGNVINVSATAAALKTKGFYDKDYFFNFKTTIKKGYDLESILNNNQVTFLNKANVKVDSTVKDTNQVTTKLNAKKLTVIHYDKKDNTELKKETFIKFTGDTYNVSPLKNLKDKKGHHYVSFDGKSYKGTMADKDITLRLPYVIPKITVNADRVEIFTNAARKDNGLKTLITLSKKETDTNFADLSTLKYKISIKDVKQNKIVVSETKLYKDFKKDVTLKIPLSDKKADEKIEYQVLVEFVDNKSNIDVVTDTVDFISHGYTASEKTFKNADLKNGHISYKGVIKTIKNRTDKKVEELFETLNFKINDKVKTKTGYGFDLQSDATYTNELSQSTDFGLEMSVPESFIDTYLNYESKNKQVTIPFEETQKSNEKIEKGIQQFAKYDYPEVFVEEKTGNLFTKEQVQSGDENLERPTVYGKRKFYIPIWHDLGKSDFKVTSTAKIGINEVSIEMNQEIDVYAYMYATINSKTQTNDELLLQPIYPDKQKVEGWTAKEQEWLKK